MAFNEINDAIMVSSQISNVEIDHAADQDISHIINNRPDGEEVGQADNATLAAYAAGKGIGWSYVPFTPGQLTQVEVSGMIEALAAADGKVLAFCRSGARSCNLWGLAMAATHQQPPAEILEAASRAGHDLSGIAPILSQLYEQG